MNFNTAPCPYCGADAADWDVEFCPHLIGDYGDGTDGDRGILDGGARSDKAFDGLDDLHESLVAFARVIIGNRDVEDGLTEDERNAITLALYKQQPAPQWLGPTLENLGWGELPDQSTVQQIWTEMVPWSVGLRETMSTLGTMASTMVTFVWAQNAAEGVKEINDAIDRVTMDIRNATERAAQSRWKEAADRGAAD